MKLSPKAKRNFLEDDIVYIKVGKKIKQAREENIFYIEDIDSENHGDFEKKLRPIRKKITQTRLAQELKCSYQQIGKYEKGAGEEGNRIPLVQLLKISKFLNKPITYFLED